MARRRGRKSFKKSTCSGQYFKLKTKRGSRCACAAFTPDGSFVAQFAKGSACPIKAKSMTYAQAKRAYSR